MKKALMTGMALIAIATNIDAQDIITLRSGESERGKVIEVGTSEIKFRKESNPDGPLYAVSKDDVIKIDYTNGQTDIFQELSTHERRWFITPQLSAGCFDSFYWGGGLNAGYSFNPIFSVGVGAQLYGTLDEDAGVNMYLLGHVNFKKTEGHWFGELRAGGDFLYEEFFYEPLVGYEFKPFKDHKGNLQVSYSIYNIPNERLGVKINIGYRF